MPNITEPLKPTFKASYFVIFVATITVGILAVIGFVWLANAVLPPDDAAAFKTPLLAAWAAIASSSAIATVIGGLIKTWFKASTQSATALQPSSDEAAGGDVQNEAAS